MNGVDQEVQYATQAQQDYITNLMQSRGVEMTAARGMLKMSLTRQDAGRWIAKLRGMPVVKNEHGQGQWANVPDGRYALVSPVDGHMKFYVVSTGKLESKWQGVRFINVLASDERYPIRNKDERVRLFKEIAADPQAAMVRYGREIGRCGVCGRTLTNPESIELGIGPVCRGEMGW